MIRFGDHDGVEVFTIHFGGLDGDEDFMIHSGDQDGVEVSETNTHGAIEMALMTDYMPEASITMVSETIETCAIHVVQELFVTALEVEIQLEVMVSLTELHLQGRET